jgi:hypothetical protein
MPAKDLKTRVLRLVQRILRSFVALRAPQDDNLPVSSLRRRAPDIQTVKTAACLPTNS